jgi:hypothetical protein
MADEPETITFNYQLAGSVVAPAGSKLTDTGTGIILPDGNVVKIWESLELLPKGDDVDARDLSFTEASDMGLWYDGDMARLEEA